jgi:lipopolysaccharide transport system permease protein
MTETEVRVSDAPAEVRETREAAAAAPVFVIRPAARWPHLDLRELWHFRELFLTLVWRDIAVRYKQTSIGAAWAIIQPTLTMIVFTLIFGRLGGVDSKGLQFPLFSYSALLIWFYFASSVALSSVSLVSNRGLVTKVYFPRVLLPLAAVAVPIVDFLFASLVLLGLMAWYTTWPIAAVVLMPLFLLMALVTALGVGLFFSAVGVRYRDVPYAIPFLMQSWMFLSGVVVPLSQFPEYAQWVLSVNPMTGVINGFQWGIVGAPAPELGKTMISVGATALFFVLGLWFFRRSEPRFADTI